MIVETKPEFVIALGRHCDMPETFRYLVDAGIPFLMEKPWGVDAETVEGLARLAEERRAWVGVPFFTRYSFWAVRAKQMIEAGEFGAVSHIVFRMIRPTMQRYIEWDSPWMDKKAEAGGGALPNLGGHGFDIARFITGEEPEVVSAAVSYRVNRREVEDYGLATLRTPSGILIHNEVGYTMPTWPAKRRCSGRCRRACTFWRPTATRSSRRRRDGRPDSARRSGRRWRHTGEVSRRRYRRANALARCVSSTTTTARPACAKGG
ncbi:MAG: Gfo/Idh/MocA family protein [Dehalococcoidia bacterium]